MGKYSGKLLTIYIAPSGVRVCEGENKTGDPNVTRFFMVGGVQEYFSMGSPSQPTTITNLSGLIAAIVSECKAHLVTAKRVMICANCFALRTDIVQQDIVGGMKNLLTGDIKSLRSKKGKDEDFEPLSPDKMACKCSWGELTVNGKVKRVVSRTTGDKYMLRSIVQEFYSYGYDVIYISGGMESLINFRQTEPASFDSQGKIIFDFDIGCLAMIFVKDIPVQMLRLGMPDRDMLLDRINSMLKQALPITGRNPKIYLMGAAFRDTELYGRVIDYLEDEGYTVYDWCNRPEVPEDYDDRVVRGDILPVLTPDYSENIAMLLAPFSKIMPQLTPTISMSDVFKKNSQAVATLVLAGSILTLLVTGGFAIKRLIELRSIDSNPSALANLQSQIAVLNQRQQSLNATIDTLTQADSTILNIMGFIDANRSDRVVVVSVDTRDMLPGTVDGAEGVTVNTTTPATGADPNADPSGDIFTGTTGGPGSVRENIVIRGYAKSGNEAVSYYNRFYNSGLAVDPVLNGVERYELPDGDEVYVFEIEIASGGDLQ